MGRSCRSEMVLITFFSESYGIYLPSTGAVPDRNSSVGSVWMYSRRIGWRSSDTTATLMDRVTETIWAERTGALLTPAFAGLLDIVKEEQGYRQSDVPEGCPVCF